MFKLETVAVHLIEAYNRGIIKKDHIKPLLEEMAELEDVPFFYNQKVSEESIDKVIVDELGMDFKELRKL